MFSCRHATRLVSDALDRPLSWPERCQLGVHLLFCPPCARFRRAARWVHGKLRSADDDGLPGDARARIRLALERAARGEQGDGFSGSV
jgi:hypothetical protein